MSIRDEILKRVRARQSEITNLASILTPAIEQLIDEYLEELRPVIGGDAIDDPAIRRILEREVLELAMNAVLSNHQILEVAQNAIISVAEPTNPVAYLYLGPDEDVIAPGGYRLPRPFCDALIDKWLTMEEIAALDNQQIPDAIISRGGYNCRHQWYPLYEGETEEYEHADVGEANRAARRRK